MATPQVLIVGAGPVGMTLALALTRRDIPVRIIDKAAARTDKSKALVMWPRTLEMFEFEAYSEPFVAAGSKAVAAHVFANGESIAKIALTQVASRFDYGLMIPQSETERILEEGLTALSVKVERNTELLRYVSGEASVTATLRADSGLEEEITVPYLAGCDGAHSVVRHGSTASFEGSTLPSSWMLADIRIGGDLRNDEVTVSWTKHGILAIFPIAGDRFRIIADLNSASKEDQPAPTMHEVQGLLDTRAPGGLRALDSYWSSTFRINERKVKDYRFGRTFLLGDAAHVHSPAGGQGMNTGMQDAFNLAWKLALTLKGAPSAALLDTYSSERSAVGTMVLRNADLITKVGVLRNPILQALRNFAVATFSGLSALQHRAIGVMTEIAVHYEPNALNQKLPGTASEPPVGHRAPDCDLANEKGSRLYLLLQAHRFVILSVGVPSVRLPDDLALHALSVDIARHPQYSEGHVYLIRPDGYVAMSTTLEHVPAMLRTFADILHAAS